MVCGVVVVWQRSVYVYQLLNSNYTLVGNLTDKLGYGYQEPMPIAMSSNGTTGEPPVRT